MILQEIYLSPNDAKNIFRLVADKLSKNLNTQIIICNDILNILRTGNYYNINFHNEISPSGVSEWYTLHKSNAFSLEIARLEIRPFAKNYSQVIKFNFDGYSFSDDPYNLREFDFWQHEIKEFLVIELS